MRHAIAAAVVVGLVACQAPGSNPRSSQTSGDLSSGPGQAGGGDQGTPTPTPGPSGSVQPSGSPEPTGPPSTSSIAFSRTDLEAPAGTFAPGATSSLTPDPASPWQLQSLRLPLPVSRFDVAVADGLLVAAGGLHMAGAERFAIIDLVAVASAEKLTRWATGSLPVPICDHGLTIDHKGRILLVGGVTFDAAAERNTPIADVYLGTVGADALTWAKAGVLSAPVSAYTLISAADRRTHYVIGGSGTDGPVANARVITSNDDGTVTERVVPNVLPVALFGAGGYLDAAGKRLFLLGGTIRLADGTGATTFVATDSVLVATIGDDGLPGTFAPEPGSNLGGARSYFKLLAGNTLLALGGNETGDPRSGTSAETLLGTFDASGSLTFSQDAVLPLPIQHYGLAVTPQDAIIAGGTHAGEFEAYSDKLFKLPLGD